MNQRTFEGDEDIHITSIKNLDIGDTIIIGDDKTNKYTIEEVIKKEIITIDGEKTGRFKEKIIIEGTIKATYNKGDKITKVDKKDDAPPPHQNRNRSQHHHHHQHHNNSNNNSHRHKQYRH